jgi:hypothetical protein
MAESLTSAMLRSGTVMTPTGLTAAISGLDGGSKTPGMGGYIHSNSGKLIITISCKRNL